MNLKPVLNKTSPRAHTELEFDMLGVPKKLVKYVVHLSKRRKLIFLILFLSHKLPKLQLTDFWSQGILGVKTIFYFYVTFIVLLKFNTPTL
jgi:hypothetical protein